MKTKHLLKRMHLKSKQSISKCHVVAVAVSKSGNVLDTYIIDPKTGEGTNSANEAVSLPQTGNNSMTNILMVFGALIMIVIGLAVVLKSGIFDLRKENEE